jgi:hypothetical protein
MRTGEYEYLGNRVSVDQAIYTGIANTATSGLDRFSSNLISFILLLKDAT